MTTKTTATYWATEDEAHTSWLTDVAQAVCPECGSRPGECYMICSHHPEYYSAWQDMQDDFYNDQMSDAAWRREAQYEAALVAREEAEVAA